MVMFCIRSQVPGLTFKVKDKEGIKNPKSSFTPMLHKQQNEG
jgi:hypothetical protein